VIDPRICQESHKKDGLSFGNQAGDDVRNGLALAGARGPLNNQVVARKSGIDDKTLAGVRIQD
jgi:hypothetical protein